VTESLKPLACLLRSGGHEVEVARNGLEALEALDVVTPDVVVTDVRMPVMDGVAFLRAVESSPSHHGRVPVIVITGELGNGELARARFLGARAVFEKGCMSKEQLLGAISVCTAQRRARNGFARAHQG
jgi:CheY-like chemotaxis protein